MDGLAAGLVKKVDQLGGPGQSLAILLQEERAVAELARRQGALAAVSAFDPHHWCLLRLQLWDEGMASVVVVMAEHCRHDSS